MARIMTKKANLPKNNCQEYGVQQLQPKIVYDKKEDDAHSQQPDREQNLISVIPRLLIQQASFLNNMFQSCVLIRRCTLDGTNYFNTIQAITYRLDSYTFTH